MSKNPSTLNLLASGIGHTWNLPNTVIGLVFGLGGRFSWDAENRVTIIDGGWMVQIFRRLGYAGMCVGDVVLCAFDLKNGMPEIYAHELVHAVQGRLLGPLYLPMTLLSYAIGFVLCPTDAHDASPMEIWADVASGNANRNRYLYRLRKRKHPRNRE